jgi:CheY-like chemotaxis protein
MIQSEKNGNPAFKNKSIDYDLSGKNVLVADASFYYSRLFELNLYGTGANVFRAYNAQDALKLAQATEFDLISVNPNLNGVSGIELLDKLQAHYLSIDAKVPIIATLSDHKMHTKADLLAKGFVDCMLLPASEKEYIKTIGDNIKNYQNN